MIADLVMDFAMCSPPLRLVRVNSRALEDGHRPCQSTVYSTEATRHPQPHRPLDSTTWIRHLTTIRQAPARRAPPCFTRHGGGARRGRRRQSVGGAPKRMQEPELAR